MSKQSLAALPVSYIGATFLKLPEVKRKTGKGRSGIYRGVADGTFPAPVKLGERASGWVASEVEAWCEARIAERNAKAAA